MTIMNRITFLHFKFLQVTSGILFLFLTACGVRGPLYLPPPPPPATKPSVPEPIGTQYPTPQKEAPSSTSKP
jgi:predicted small lipoprotein YifL